MAEEAAAAAANGGSGSGSGSSGGGGSGVGAGLHGATHVYTFWQGMPLAAKQALGAMFKASSTTVAVAIVQPAIHRSEAPVDMMRELGFGKLELVGSALPVSMAGSGHKKWAYVFKKTGLAVAADKANLPEPARIQWMEVSTCKVRARCVLWGVAVGRSIPIMGKVCSTVLYAHPMHGPSRHTGPVSRHQEARAAGCGWGPRRQASTVG
jgi:hypothetical protein